MKHAVNLSAIAVIGSLLAAAPALALEDTPANRAAEADHYLQASPPKALMSDMAQKMAVTLPEDQRPIFINLMTKNLDMNAVANLMRVALIKNFSADELKALADFYGSPVGQSATAKFGNYMADAMGPLKVELAKAVATTQEQMKAK